MENFYFTSGNENESPYVKIEENIITINNVPFKADFLLSVVTDDDSIDYHCWGDNRNISLFTVDSNYQHALTGEKQFKVMYDGFYNHIEFRIHRDSLKEIFDIYLNDFLQ